VAEQQPGLRFDIYERVHLHEAVAAIRELNEVELIPHIQVLSQGEQAVLQGNLLLTGTYVGEAGEDSRTLEHLIPVEITLPMNRIQRVEDIQVEIENFDIDLLSSRSLNVTGVLSLQGVEMISSGTDPWREEEEVIFIHEPGIERPGQHEETPLPLVEREPVYVASTADYSQEEPAPSENEFQSLFETAQTEPYESPSPQEVIVQVEEKKELKLAFGKKAADAVELKPYGIKSLLSKAGSVFQAPGKRKDEDASLPQAEESKADALEWKRLFLGKRDESQEFSKVRMCIVQKEETLETIASRYQINPREIQLLNRLSEPVLSAGQVIYLPR
jgi:stage VI sporulation protein D